MFAKARKKGILRAVLWAVCWIAVAVILLAANGFGIFKLIGGTRNIHYMSANDMVGSYVEADLDWLVGEYAYTTRDGKTISREYVFQTDRGVWLGVVCRGEDRQRGNALMEETQAYIEEKTDAITKNFTVTGTILEMDEESARYYKRALSGAELEGTVTTYYLQIGYIGNQDAVLMWLMTGGAVLALGAAVWMLVRGFTGAGQKKLLDYCKKSENPEATKERLEAFWRDTPVIGGRMRMNEEWMLYETGGTQHLLETPHIIWAYQSTTQHRTNGIKSGKSYALVLCDDEGKRVTLSASEPKVQAILEHIDEHFSHIVLGYNADLVQLYHTDRAGFRQLKQQPDEQPDETAAAAAIPVQPEEPAAAPQEDTIDRSMFD